MTSRFQSRVSMREVDWRYFLQHCIKESRVREMGQDDDASLRRMRRHISASSAYFEQQESHLHVTSHDTLILALLKPDVSV